MQNKGANKIYVLGMFTHGVEWAYKVVKAPLLRALRLTCERRVIDVQLSVGIILPTFVAMVIIFMCIPKTMKSIYVSIRNS